MRVDRAPKPSGQEVYSLTPAGEQALDEWLLVRPSLQSNKDELLVRLYCLDRMPKDAIVRRLEERLDNAQQEARRLGQELNTVQRTDPAQLGLLLTLEAALSRAEALSTWCTRAIALLSESSESRERDAATRDAVA